QPPSRPPPPRFRAAPPDLTLRAVLARWARAAGWTFEAEHWALDVDIPLAGKAELPGDFKTAVRALLAATEPWRVCRWRSAAARCRSRCRPCATPRRPC
ncbi:toxin co-regulated pilus biosynthesis Q family protein, partial [Bordetella pertussis]|uniref:toxin co-regulated pilus biosynthesis Q family protein n=1 Tax=Bordetella pertussis TaxID=520 RepID=UPI0021CC1460